MPLIRRIPKRGFGRKRRDGFQIVNLRSLEKVREADSITPEELKKAGLIKRAEEPVKILGTGEVKKAVTIKAHAFSRSAVAKIKKAGGKTEEIENADKRKSA